MMFIKFDLIILLNYTLVTMSHTSQHFGKGINTAIFTPRTLNSKSGLRACLGAHNKDPQRKWYGVYSQNGEKIDPSQLSFCEFCGENGFTAKEVFPITKKEFPFVTQELSCDAPITEKYKSIIGDKRCVYVGGIKFNVNIIDEADKVWSPILKIPTDLGINAASKGVLLAPIPSMSYWEFVVKADDAGLYNESQYYYKVKCTFEDGRSIIIQDQQGNTDYYTPMKGGMVSVNSYKTGHGNRFFFQAPSKIEIDANIEPIHNNSSNKLFITVTIYEKKDKGLDTTRGPTLGSYPFRDGSVDHDHNMGTTRGYSGGSNFGTTGYSTGVITEKVNATFTQVKQVYCIIQLVNNEDDSEKEYMSRKIQDQVDIYKQTILDNMISQRDALDFKIKKLQEEWSTRSIIFSREEQLDYLI